MSNNIEKIKVVWICHFSNLEIQKRLPLVKQLPQFAPWISLLINEFENHPEIELHVISPFEWLKRDSELEINGISYYFFRTGIPFIHRHWPTIFKLDYWTEFYFFRKKIKRIVNRINPDIINLHGIENPYYSMSIFDLKNYPILITIQGLYTYSNSHSKSFIDKMRLRVESKILSEFYNFGVRVKFLKDNISSRNPKANFYWHKYPYKFNHLIQSNEEITDNDVIFFARLSKDKGIEDLLHAISIVKNSLPQVSVKIIGKANHNYTVFLYDLVKRLNIEENVKFLGFLPTQESLHNYVLKSRLNVLPTYNDILPGTIIESMFLKVPVLAYSANGVVDINFERENIRLVEVGNRIELANQIEIILKDVELRNRLRKNAFDYANTNFDNSIEAQKLIEVYNTIIQSNK